MSSQEVKKAGDNVLYSAHWEPSGASGGSNPVGSVSDIGYDKLSPVFDTGPKSPFGQAHADAPIVEDTPVDNAVTRDEMLARLEAVDARNDARLKEFIGEVRLSNHQLQSELGSQINEIGNQISDHRFETKSEFLILKSETKDDFLNFKSESLDRSNDVIKNVWGAAIAIVTLTLTILAFGNDRFSSGLAITEYVHQLITDRTLVSVPAPAPAPAPPSK
jgi:hypothetical protein